MSFCIRCGNRLAEADRFCPRCGQPAAAPVEPGAAQGHLLRIEDAAASAAPPSDEQELLSFGPLGVQIYRGRPGVFSLCQQNNTRVILTRQRLLGTQKGTPLIPPGLLIYDPKKLRFQVPLGDILAMEPCTLLLARGVWIRYRQGPKEAEVSILGAVFISHHLDRLLQLLQGTFH
mgnify:CR=1 FL=1